MKNIFLFTAVLLLGHFGQAQSAASNVRLSQKYATKMLEDYHENAKTKIEDLFAYFQLLTDTSLSNDLKKEVIKNIKNCFQNQNPDVIDFISETNGKIKLNSLIDKLLLSEPITLRVTNAWQNSSENSLSWKTIYTLSLTKSSVSRDIQVTQIIYLFEQNKTFGNASKNVTVSFLGKME